MRFKRTRYQFGCVERKKRKNGPDVWVYRWREPETNGTITHKSKMIGSVKQYPSESEAWRAAEALRLSANPDNPAQHGVSWNALIDRYVAEELPARQDTSTFYLACLENRLRPKWGHYALADVKPFAMEAWLKGLRRSDGSRELSPKSKKHLRSLMHILYGCAMRWGFVPIAANPFGNRLIRIKNASKKLRKRRSLTVEQFHALLQHRLIAAEPFRTIVIAAICLGLRCSELLALKWSDFDWEKLTINVEKGVVRGVFDGTKTTKSEGEVALAAELAQVIWSWKLQSPFNGPEDFIFADPDKAGRAPYNPYNLQRSRLRAAGLDIGFVADGLGWHTFRHTYRTLLDQTGAPISVQQELMRHADPRTTLAYGEAPNPSKRKANEQVVRMVLPMKEGGRG